MTIVKKFWYIFLILLIVPIIIFGKDAFTAAQKGSMEKAYAVKQSSLQNILTLSATVDAKEKVQLTFAGGGKLSWVGVKEGDYVKKYQGIASLDSRSMVKQSQKILNNYDITRRTFDSTQQSLNNVAPKDTNASNNLTWDKEKSQYTLNNSVLDVEIARVAEENSYLSSPLDGTITKIDAKYPGMYISPAQGFEVINLDTMYLSAKADQTELSKIQEGMNVEVLFDADTSKKVNGYIQKIALKPKADESSTVYEIEVSFDRYTLGSMIKLGMTADVNLVTSTKENILTIPSTYIKNDNEKKEKYVLKKDKNAKQIRTVIKTGETQNGMVEVTSGLVEGDIVYDNAK
jgi:RND family efflux transporter MFP subunit